MRSSFEEYWRQRFVERGRRFDDDAGIAGWTESGLCARLRHFEKVWTSDSESGLWLDAGCGAGSYTRLLVERGHYVVGLDYSLPSVQKARARCDSGIIWVVGDVTCLPVCPGRADGVLCLGVVQALSSPEHAIRELYAAVKPGGEVWVDALNRNSLSTIARRVMAHLLGRELNLRYDTARELAQILGDHGASSIKVYWVPILPGFLSRFQPVVESDICRRALQSMPFLGSLLSHAILVSARRDV